MLRDAEARLSRTSGAHGFLVARVRAYLGDVLRARGRPREAEALLLPAHAQLVAARGAAAPATQVAVRALATLYATTGRPAEAARYRALLLAPAARDAGAR